MSRYFLTAYGIALKHGFQGNEEEWLERLTAYGQALAAGFTGSYDEWLHKIADPVPQFSVGETVTLEAGLPARVEIAGTKEFPVLNFGIPRGEGLEDALMKTGGIMIGPLSMGDQRLYGIPAPVYLSDAVNKEYADSIKDVADKAAAAAVNAQNTANRGKELAEMALPITGGTLNGPIVVMEPTAAGHPVRLDYMKTYVTGKHREATVTLTASGWSSSAPYTQTVDVAWLGSTDLAHVSPVYSATLATAITQKENWAMVCKAVTAEGSITFTCFEEKPSVNLSVQLEVNR